MSVNEGYMNDVKMKLIEKIAASDASITTANVLANWKTNIAKLSEDAMPAITVRIMPSASRDIAYGRRLSPTERGIYVIYNFTAHVWALRASGSAKAETAQDLADAIETYLLQNAQDTSTGIERVFDINKRESQPERGARRYQRIIMTGRIEARKPF